MSLGTVLPGTGSSWPAGLTPAVLRLIDVPTPYLVTDLDVVADRLAAFRAALPAVQTFFAMKCNPAPEVLRTLAARGSGFEIASLGELRMLQTAGVDPAGALYSNPVKPPAHIAEAYAAGLWRFSFDSPNELAKLAEHAPGAAVYVRLRVDDSTSVFPLSRKFGTDVEDAYDLMLLAARLGLRPYGVTFHVGSQCTDAAAWRVAIGTAGELMRRLAGDGITLEMIDLGGGFPARYADRVPAIETIGAVVTAALDELPYRPTLVAAEPGRHLVAEAGVIAATIIGREQRGDEHWLFTEVGAFHGLMEVLQTPGGWAFPVATSLPGGADRPQLPFTVTGPTCDSSDTIGYGIMLPADLAVGDVLYLGSTGAYTLAYAAAFNGFPPPTPIFVGAPAVEAALFAPAPSGQATSGPAPSSPAPSVPARATSASAVFACAGSGSVGSGSGGSGSGGSGSGGSGPVGSGGPRAGH